MPTEARLVEILQILKEKPAGLKDSAGRPLNLEIVEYLTIALQLIRFIKNVFMPGGSYYKPKFIQFNKVWGIVKSLWELAKTTKII